ncbi:MULTISPECIES: hypothetical protein [Thioalkalivibrio]|uniref:FAD/FMN-containing dehydrogenase n=1 Tax=Thioalkalivibrio halophilus TaxID=252474 RepID=A0A1V2ZZV9_9GAMM|nr:MULTISPECIES: hypothetical protein [Thioalkalivibrio]OOC10640.1 hypothetical protein B1A74_05030 [Thioalkalivibrio halophilus]PYG01282.1 hypothetical protein D893_02114 [Thioalkalivibrio sp. ALE21]
MQALSVLKKTVVLSAGLGLLLAAAPAAADLSEGDAFPDVTLNDQHGEPLELPGDARVVLMTVEMAPADITNDVLGDMGPEAIEEAGIRYVADTHGMPPFVLENVVMPRMQERPYRTGVTEGPGDMGFMPHQRDHVSVVFLDGEGTVTGTGAAASEAALRQMLEGAGD